MRIQLAILLVFAGFSASSQTLNIIPRPATVTKPPKAGTFHLDASTAIVLDGTGMENGYNFFNDYLERFYHFKLKVEEESGQSKNTVRLNYERMDNALPGAYKLSIDNSGISISGDNETGVFYAIQTLIQLLPLPDKKVQAKVTKLSIPYVSIEDSPRFEYRGLHLDVGRHFMPVEFVKRYIDYIALHKMNYFHWHLTEDQGWRIEIKKYPNLTTKGAWRNGTITGRYPGTGNDGLKYGGYYTQEEVKDIVAYAKQRYITVVPEIEMPGHSSAAIASYPELSCFPGESTQHPKQCTWSGDSTGKQVQQTWGVFNDVFCAGKDQTFEFMENVLTEVLELFPSTYIHVGGDECPKNNWKRCPNCQKRIKDLNLKDEHELQSYFIQRIEKFLNNKGRKLIGWDEILEGGLAPNAVVMSWRGEEGGIAAAKENHDVVMTPGNWCYFDHSQSENEDSVTIGGYTTIEKVYGYEPIPPSLNADQAKHILGAQGNVWTEYMKNPKKVEYMIFPRLSGLSEVLWSPKHLRNWSDFERRLMMQFKRYELWNTNYSKAYYDLKATVKPNGNSNSVLWTLESRAKNAIIEVGKIVPGANEIKMKKPAPLGELVNSNSKLKAVLKGADMKPLVEIQQEFHFNKATGRKVTLTIKPTDKYPGDGGFTLVNGVINEKGMTRTREFLGFLGTDCEAVIDLGKSQLVSFVVVNALRQEASWIWQPKSVEVFGSDDGVNFHLLKTTDVFTPWKGNKGTMTLSFKASYARFIKVLIRNWGEIAEGNPGAGTRAWLFVDEIEIQGPERD
jgi:hexosaminidase